MDHADTIRARGFRRWYERQLVESHLWLVVGLLALIGCAIAIETIAFRESLADFLALLATGGAGAALCGYAWTRFHRQLGFAEHIAGQATCGRCRNYGRFKVTSVGRGARVDDPDRLQVRCRDCGHEWSIA